ncbi:hypothetical protein [Acidocella aquatica]|uniref:hypothetical protein n=1 Tax=Acidocella aquatica TaxID=1922313 RepID=UPI0024E09FCB|nr:hypothetical protein [Acidocella aquatica]
MPLKKAGFIARLFYAGIIKPKNKPAQCFAAKKGIISPISWLVALLKGNHLGYDHANRPSRYYVGMTERYICEAFQTPSGRQPV